MKRPAAVFIIAFILFFSLSYVLKKMSCTPQPVVPDTQAEAGRIISLAPSITEIIFLLGLDSRLVGNTTYCNYPPEARNIEKVGGYSTPDFEKIVLLKPDVVFMMLEHKYIDLDSKFRRLGIETVFLSDKTTADIIESVRIIGRRCGVEDTAERKAAELEEGLKKVSARWNGPNPSIIITVGKNMGSSGLKTVFAAGKGTYYDNLIQIAGGKNGTPDTPQQYANMSGEDILLADPDIIIDIVPDLPEKKVSEVKKTWSNIPGLKAVNTGNIYILTNEYAARPGPSFLSLLDDILDCMEQWKSTL